ncbi:MAG: WbqC family protein [bacterium]|jgi:hypothetical protein
MKLAIMQPYFFPYIGYYQLVNSVDQFIFYDDVNFIKRGWINRTNIITREARQLLSVSLSQSSQNKRINEIKLKGQPEKILRTIEFTYKKAPYFDDVFPLVQSCILSDYEVVSEFAANTIRSVSEYLGIKTDFSFSSEFHRSTAGYEKARRLIDICRKENADVYINSIGGQAIYTKEEFEQEGIDLYFLKTKKISYDQNPIRKEGFEANLSMIDVLMFNGRDQVNKLLEEYELI